jgi:hypothetical protein
VLLAPASLLDPYINWQRSTNTLVGIITIPLIALVARRVAGRRVAVIAAVLAAVYPNLWMNDSLVMAESVSTLCAVLALWAALRHHDRFDWRSALLCGAAVGVAALARSELLLLAPLFALIGLRSRPFRTWAPQAVLVGVSAIAMMVPWAAFNLTRFDSPVLITTNEGNTLDGANCDETYYGPNIGGWSIGCVLDDIDRPGEDASERSRRQREEALTYVSDNRGRVPPSWLPGSAERPTSTTSVGTWRAMPTRSVPVGRPGPASSAGGSSRPSRSTAGGVVAGPTAGCSPHRRWRWS